MHISDFPYLHKWAKLAFILQWFVLPFATLMLAALGWQYAQEHAFSRSDWAAWVQAIGSIAAIVGAIIVGNRSSRQMRQLERDQRQVELNRQLDIIDTLLFHIEQLANEWLQAHSRRELDQITSIEPDKFDALSTYIKSIPPLEIPAKDMAVDLIALPLVMKTMSDAIKRVSATDCYNTPAVFDEFTRQGCAYYAREIHERATKARSVCMTEWTI